MGATIWARRIASVVAFASILVLLGWCLDIPLLAGFVPGRGVTRPESAVAFLLATAGVWGLTSPRSGMRALGLLVAALSGAIGITALVIRAMSSAGPLQLTSVPTALGLVFASTGLLLSPLRHRRWLRVFDVMALSTLIGGILGILSSFYGWYEATALAVAFPNTALPSAIALAGLGLSIALLHAERGLAGAVLDPGPSGALLRRLLPAAILLPATLEFLESFASQRGWFQGFGNAPLVVTEISGIVWLVARSARSVRRFNHQREQAQRALEEEMRAHASLLTERELRFRLLAETAPQIVWTATPDGSLDYLSPAWSRFTGGPEEFAKGWRWGKHIHSQDVGRVTHAWKTAAEKGEPYELEYRLRRHDGRYRWFLSRAIPARDAEQRIVRWYGADTDIHDLREAREALRQSEERFRVALQTRDFIAWTQDAELRYTWVYNPAAGYEADRSMGKTDLELLDFPDDAERLTALKRCVVQTGVPFSGQVPLRIQGEQRFFEMRLTALSDEDGVITGMAGAAYDITDRKRSEEAILSAQKYELVGQLAAGVAHDFNNLLTGIIGNADFALSRLPVDMPASARAALQRVIDSGESAAVLTQQLLAYAGKGRFHVQPTDLRRLKESLAVLIRASVPSGIRLQFEVPADLPFVRADASQLQQLLANLLINAVEAIGEQPGHVVMSMRVVELERDSALSLDVPEADFGSYVQIEVRDDGPGMPEKTLKRAFEPFFSTKFVGRGLGLSACQGIAHAHGGGIVARSEPGAGTTILVTLPCLQGPVEQEPGPTSPREGPSEIPVFAGAGVLFVDDEAQLREIGKTTLMEAGYRVWLAENGAQALEMVRAMRSSIQVIVLDMTMPIMGGAEAARQLRQEQVNLPIVASSGYTEVETLERFGETAPLFLRKPYRPSELLSKVAAALGEASHPTGRTET